MAKLMSRDVEVLEDLDSACTAMDWARPLDCGGFNSSDHSYRLSKLERMGYAESRQRRAWMTRGSKEYRITSSGRAALRAKQGGAE